MKKLLTILFLIPVLGFSQQSQDKMADKMFRQINQIRFSSFLYQLKHPRLEWMRGVQRFGLKKFTRNPELDKLARQRCFEMISKKQKAGHNTSIKELDEYSRCTSYHHMRNGDKVKPVFVYVEDRGVPSRGHRKAILSKEYTQVGIAVVKKGPRYWTCIVQY